MALEYLSENDVKPIGHYLISLQKRSPRVSWKRSYLKPRDFCSWFRSLNLRRNKGEERNEEYKIALQILYYMDVFSLEFVV